VNSSERDPNTAMRWPLPAIVVRASTDACVGESAAADCATTATDAIVGRSAAIAELRTLVHKLGRRGDATVLVSGESGSGKDLVARALHGCSPRNAHPFVNVTCTALPTHLLESELFGHERGAFTDAKTRHLGLLEQARGGTLFLDEIGDMEPALQAKLLRVLEEKRFRRVGGTADIDADVRIVAATHADLAARVRAGTFREDLYYRLAVLLVDVPTLRARKDDIEELALYFLGRVCTADKRCLHLSRAGARKLEQYDWPGNVRELRNVIERAVYLTDGASIGPADLQVACSSGSSRPMFELPADGIDMDALQRELVVQALERTRGNVTRAARLLGMNRDQMRYRVQKYRLAESSPL
jgi:two-component system response regulator AtoC